jgi:Kef-type K+ transport system membrane component KefB
MEHIDLLLPLVLILVTARLAGMVSRRLGMPAVLGELLAGLILGPSLLGWVSMNNTLGSVADIGVLLLMFIAGLETDLLQMRQVGKASLFTAVGGVVLPFAAGMAVGSLLKMDLYASMFLATALTATSVSVSVQVLNEAGRLRSRAGIVIMGAAVTDDVLGILLLSVVLALAGQGGSLGLTLLRLVLFFPVALLVGKLLVEPLIRWIGREHATEAGLTLVLALILFYGWAAEAAGGLAAITGAYVAGVLVGRQQDVREWVKNGVSVLGYGIFVPVFFVTVGLRTDLHAVLAAPGFVLGLTAVAVVTKALGAGLGARLSGCTWGDTNTIGAGMVARGEVALVVATLGLGSGLMTDTTFTVVIIMALATTVVTPLLMKLTLRPAQPADEHEPAPILTLAPVTVEVDGA